MPMLPTYIANLASMELEINFPQKNWRHKAMRKCYVVNGTKHNLRLDLVDGTLVLPSDTLITLQLVSFHGY